jgi:nitrile hydratase accessory protein
VSDPVEPVFREPWEAQAFALAVALHERGVFTWSEWSAALAAELEKARSTGADESGEGYYRHWLAALEKLVAAKGIADQATLQRHHHAWEHAAHRTPHGSPIHLRPDDFAE